MARLAQTSFAFGELSPRLFGAVTTDQAQGGCRRLENALITRIATLRKRLGGRFSRSTLSDAQAALVGFSIPGVGDFVVSLTASNAEIINSSEAVVTTLSTPYAAADLNDIQWTQTIDRLYLTHKSYQTRVIKYDQIAGTFSIGLIATGLKGPSVDPRTRRITLKIVGSSAPFTVEASEDYFIGTDQDSVFRYRTMFIRPNVYRSGRIMEVAALGGATLVAQSESNDWTGPWTPAASLTGVAITTSGAPTGGAGETHTLTAASALFTHASVGQIIDVDAAAAPNSKLSRITNFTSSTVVTAIIVQGPILNAAYTNSRFFPISERDTDSILVTPTSTEGTIDLFATQPVFNSLHLAGAAEAGARFFVNDGTVLITGITDANRATGIVQSKLATIQTIGLVPKTTWSQGLSRWSGFPRACSYHEDRIVVAGPDRFGNRVLSSRVGQYENWTPGADDDAPLNFAIAGLQASPISWLLSGRDLLGGTERENFSISGRPLTPTNLGVRLHAPYGGAATQPQAAGGAALYVQRDRAGVREMAFNFDEDKYRAPDLTDLAEHLFIGKRVVRLAHMSVPDELVVAVQNDGSLLVLSYRRDQGILGWNRWVGLVVESALSFPGTDRDQLWLVVRRTINAQTKRYIEIFDDTNLPGDSMKTVTSPGSLTITGLGHLEGQVVGAVADGKYLGRYTVTSSAITLTGIASPPASVTVGLEFTFKYSPMPPEYQDQSGVTHSRRKTLSKSAVLLHESRGGTLSGVDLASWGQLDSIDETPLPISGWIPSDGEGVTDRLPDVTLTHDTLQQFEVLSFARQVDTRED